jgi:hypothetical protein
MWSEPGTRHAVDRMGSGPAMCPSEAGAGRKVSSRQGGAPGDVMGGVQGHSLL